MFEFVFFIDNIHFAFFQLHFVLSFFGFKLGPEGVVFFFGLLDLAVFDAFMFGVGLGKDFFCFHFGFIGEAFGGEAGFLEGDISLPVTFFEFAFLFPTEKKHGDEESENQPGCAECCCDKGGIHTRKRFIRSTIMMAGLTRKGRNDNRQLSYSLDWVSRIWRWSRMSINLFQEASSRIRDWTL